MGLIIILFRYGDVEWMEETDCVKWMADLQDS